MENHWQNDTDLVIEEKTLFRQVGWVGHVSKAFIPKNGGDLSTESGGISPVYVQIATWKDGGWND